MRYNERLAEIMMRKDDKTYRETARAVIESKIDVYNFYQKYGRVPKLSDPNANLFVMRRSLEQLEKELNEGSEEKNERSGGLTSLILA
ncbi:hypothetical protein HYV89_00985 [Candidatus Woesearchaeota archaeon]|nr:hypothetical protein [Candidatus Woesearchaeota archaeon]